MIDKRNKRILIIGSPGTGKSTLARQLSLSTGLPVVHLDQHWHNHGLWPDELVTKKSQWRDHVSKLTKEDTWIMDGNYTSTLDIRIPAADLVILLDYPRRIALFRTLKRRVKYHKTKRPDMPNTWREKLSVHLVVKIWQFKKSRRPRIMELLKNKKAGQVVCLRSPLQTKKFLKE